MPAPKALPTQEEACSLWWCHCCLVDVLWALVLQQVVQLGAPGSLQPPYHLDADHVRHEPATPSNRQNSSMLEPTLSQRSELNMLRTALLKTHTAYRQIQFKTVCLHIDDDPIRHVPNANHNRNRPVGQCAAGNYAVTELQARTAIHSHRHLEPYRAAGTYMSWSLGY